MESECVTLRRFPSLCDEIVLINPFAVTGGVGEEKIFGGKKVVKVYDILSWVFVVILL